MVELLRLRATAGQAAIRRAPPAPGSSGLSRRYGGLHSDVSRRIKCRSCRADADRTDQATGSHHEYDPTATERLGIALTTTLDRRDFGIDFNREAAGGLYNIGWDVEVQAALELYLEAD